MFKRSIVFLLGISLALLAGCTTRPPSAAIFMAEKRLPASQNSSASLDSAASKGVGGVSLVGLVDLKKDTYEINKEWNVNLAVQNGYRNGYFAYGFGLQLLNPYAYIGLASHHFGVMAWSNIYPVMRLMVEPEDVERDLYEESMGFGTLLIEQFDLSNDKKVGLTVHFSRTAAAYTEHGSGFPANWPSVIHYYEFGGGGYMTIPFLEHAFSIELRYSRLYTYKNHQLSLMLNLIS